MDDIPVKSHNLSRSFLLRPKVHFEAQHADEEVVLVVRKHPATQISWITNAILLIIVGMFLVTMIIPLIMTQVYQMVFFLFLIFFTLSYVWLNFLFWYFTVGIITTKRIIDLDFINILYKEFTATTIQQVSDITTKVGGFFGTILNYGNVFVKTEGFAQNIEFDVIPRPSDVVTIINNLMKKYRIIPK